MNLLSSVKKITIKKINPTYFSSRASGVKVFTGLCSVGKSKNIFKRKRHQIQLVYQSSLSVSISLSGILLFRVIIREKRQCQSLLLKRGKCCDNQPAFKVFVLLLNMKNMIHTLRIKHGSIATLTLGMCTFFFLKWLFAKQFQAFLHWMYFSALRSKQEQQMKQSLQHDVKTSTGR